MPNETWFRPALGFVVLITAFRVITLYHADIDLFVDESQYWLWGQELAFGYYSKPPLIGWTIRLFTEIAGSDAAFWVRLPAPLFHASTALVLGWVASLVLAPRAAFWVAVGYITLPMVGVGSVLISTDTIMFPFLAASLGMYLRLCQTQRVVFAVFAGALLGAAFMAKYAAIYFLICAIVAAFLVPSYRPHWRHMPVALLAFLVVISPNLIWNVVNGFSTAQHTLDNADWVRDPGTKASLNVAGLIEFFLSQFAVFGPITFGALLAIAVGLVARPKSSIEKLLIWFCVPILAIVCLQALLSQAYANWAATAYLAGSIVTFSIIARRLWILLPAIALNLVFCIMLPMATMGGSTLSLNGKTLLLERYIGIQDMSRTIEAIAIAENQTAIVAKNRDILADLFYTLDRDKWQLASVPPKKRAPNHYALSYPWAAPYQSDTVLAVIRTRGSLPCAAQKVAEIKPDQGHYRGQSYTAYIAPADCWKRGQS